MGKKNVATGGFTAVQVGTVGPRDDDQAPAPKPAKPSKSGKTKVTNVREGNATVGVQADVIVGDLNIKI